MYKRQVGVDGYIFTGKPNLKFTRTDKWDILRAVTSYSDDYIAVGGKDLNKGWIYEIKEDLSNVEVTQFPFQLMDIKCSDEGNCIAAGFGNILLRNNDQSNWQRLEIEGDFYTSIDINENGDFVVIGTNGSILLIDEDSFTINTINKPSSAFGRSIGFRNIRFFDNRGFIVGDNGNVWKSDNHGLSWEDISLDTNTNLADMTLKDDTLIIVGERGRIINYPIN